MDFFACPLMLLRSNATNGNRPMAIKVRNCTLTRPPWTGHLPTGRGLWTAPVGVRALPTAPRIGAYGLTRFACQTAVEKEIQDNPEKPR